MVKYLKESSELREADIDAIRYEAVAEAIDKLVAKTGDNREDLLLKALTLYEVAIDAAREGQRLAMLGQDYRFIREVVGLEEPSLGTTHR